MLILNIMVVCIINQINYIYIYIDVIYMSTVATIDH